MLHWIEANVIDATLEVRIVSDCVRVRKIAFEVVPGCIALQGDFAHPTKLGSLDRLGPMGIGRVADRLQEPAIGQEIWLL